MRQFFIPLLLLAHILTINAQQVDSIIDIRDGQLYIVVKIGQQWWMQENLNVGIRINGTQAAANNGVIEKYCYDDDTNNCRIYGGLYRWDEMMDYSPSDNGNPGTTRGICPAGWHVPTDEEWKELEMYLGMTQNEADMVNTWRGTGVGTKLRSGGGSGYEALYSGRVLSSGSYSLLGDYEYIWTSTEYGDYAWRRCLTESANDVGRWNTFPKTYGFSVRCIKNLCLINHIHLDVTNVSYHGCADGKIDLTVDGSGTFTYQWSTGDTIEDLTGLPAGSYRVTVTDEAGCFIEDSVIITDPAAVPFSGEEICLVTVDTVSEKNIIVWEKTPDKGIASYNIYREGMIAGQYDLIGTRSFQDIGIFKDTTSNPVVKSYRYKIAVVDTCGNESEMSPYHQTMLLMYSGTLGGVNLSWTPYEIEGGEMIIESFEIYRGTDKESLTKITGLVADISNYKDTYSIALQNPLYYRVAGLTRTPCNPASGKKSELIFTRSFSNLEDNRFCAVGYLEKQVTVYPNPSSDHTNIRFDNPEGHSYTLYIMDITGRVCRIVNDIAVAEYVLERGDLKEGIYFMELRGAKVYRGKIVVE